MAVHDIYREIIPCPVRRVGERNTTRSHSFVSYLRPRIPKQHQQSFLNNVQVCGEFPLSSNPSFPPPVIKEISANFSFPFQILGSLLVALAHSVPVPAPQDYDYGNTHNGDVKPPGFRPHVSSNPSNPFNTELRQYEDYGEEGSDTAPDYYGNDYGAGANYDYYGGDGGGRPLAPRGQGPGGSPDYRNGPSAQGGGAGAGGGADYGGGDEYANFDESSDYPPF